MSWLEREEIRKPQIIAPDLGSIDRPRLNDVGKRRAYEEDEEWSQARQFVTPGLILRDRDPQSWAISLDPIDEESAGTYYTDYQDIEDGPACIGWLSVPDCVLYNATDATAWVQLCEEDSTQIEEFRVAVLSAYGPDGDVLGKRCDGDTSPVLIEGKDRHKTIGKLRWKVTGGDDLYLSVSGSLIAL